MIFPLRPCICCDYFLIKGLGAVVICKRYFQSNSDSLIFANPFLRGPFPSQKQRFKPKINHCFFVNLTSNHNVTSVRPDSHERSGFNPGPLNPERLQFFLVGPSCLVVARRESMIKVCLPTIDMTQEQTPRQAQLAVNPRYSNPLYFSFLVISSNVSSTSVNEL